MTSSRGGGTDRRSMGRRSARRLGTTSLAMAIVCAPIDEADAAPTSARAEAQAGPGRPRVHLRTRDRPLTLYEVEPTAASERGRRRAPPSLRPICNAPCDRVVDGRQGQSFVLGGPGLSRSLPFSLLASDASLTIHARPGRRALWIAGWVLTSIGAAAVLTGAGILTAADDDRTLRRAGGFTFLGGVPLVAGGIVMVAFGRTRFRLGDGGRSGR